MKCMLRAGLVLVMTSVMVMLTAGSAGSQLDEKAKGAAGPAAEAFAKMKTLAGKWEATTPKGEKAILVYELAAHDTALVERFTDEGSHYYTNMMTMFYVNGKHLDLTHYCAANNQPSMRALLPQVDSNVIAFDFVGATNLTDANAGHMHKAVFRFADADHITSEWTWREGGKDKFTEKLEFARVK